MGEKKKLESLTSLRFLFFIFVFLSHYMIGQDRVLPHGGAFAVVFFYMLSGFSLSYGYGKRIAVLEYGDFIKKRIVQLYPMQLLTHLLRAVPFLLIPLLAGVIDIEKISSFVLKLFFLEAWVPNENIIFGYNSCAWYLSPLVFCYFIFPFLFRWINKQSKNGLFAAILGYLVLYGVCIVLIPEDKQQVFIYVAPYFRFFDFALGIVLYKVVLSDFYHNLSDKITNWGGAELLLLLLLIEIAWLPLKGFPTVFSFASVYWIPSFLIIACFIALDEKSKTKLLSARCLQTLGDASYEMYMTHLFVISITQSFCERMHISDGYSLFIVLLVSLVGSILLGIAVRKWINLPIVNYFKKHIK